MKNMMLPERNSKKLSLLLGRVGVGFLCALLLLAAGCKTEEPVDPQQNLNGDVARPTWTVPEDYDYTSSMTAVIKVASLNGQIVNDQMVNDSDVLAAFIGDECRGIATYDSGLFYLYIAGPGESVTLRYWSAHYKNLFATQPIPFVNDTQLGSTAEPYKPNWVVAKE